MKPEPCRRLPFLFVLLGLTLAGTASVRSQVPGLINYQGRIAVGTVNFEGAGLFKFALVNGAGTTTYWSNDGTSTGGSQPTAAVTLSVTKGLYSVQLGDASLANMTTVPASVFANADVRLRVWFNDGTNGFQLLTPDQRIAAVGYAMVAGTVSDGAITSSKLAPGLTLAGTTSGNFNGTLTGNVTGSAVSFTGSLAGDVTGTQSATSIPATVVTGKVLTNYVSAAGTITASDSILSAINKLNGNVTLRAPLASPTFTGVVSAPIFSGDLSGTANGFSGPLGGDVTGSQGATVVAKVGGVTASNIAAGAALANSAVSTWTGGTIVRRDSNGDFSAGRIDANQLDLGTAPGAGVGNVTLDGTRLIYTPGTSNIYVGQDAGPFFASGNRNAAFGAQALFSNTGSGNIALGYQAGMAHQSGDNNIYIGHSGTQTESNVIRIGTPGTHTDTYLAGVIRGNGSGITGITGSTPTGGVIAFAGATAPAGWLLCDGSAVSRTTYASLFAVIGTSHGSGDGTTTFNLPDYRGRFLRGVDGTAGNDTDKASRTAMNTGGNTGNLVGSVQTDQFKSHNHLEGTAQGIGDPRNIYGATTAGSSVWADWGNSGMTSEHAYTSTVGGTETRPKNANVNYLIKD